MSQGGPSKLLTTVVSEGLPPIPVKTLEKIRRWEFVDLASLLSDPAQKTEDLSMTQGSHFVVVQSLEQIQKKRKQISDLPTWLQAFSIYAAALASADPTSKEEIAGLFAHSHLIVQLSKDLRGLQWLQYDKDFRIWAAAKGRKVWGELNLSIYGRCLATQNVWQYSTGTEQKPQAPSKFSKPQKRQKLDPSKGSCFKWNFEENCARKDCFFAHKCYHCGEGHRATVCPRAPKRDKPT